MNKIHDDLILFIDKTNDNNTYVLIKDSHCVIVDLSWNTRDVEKYIIQNDLILDGLMLTHGHYDHIGESFKIAEKYNVKVYTHTLEKNVVLVENLASIMNINLYLNEAFLILFNEPKVVVGIFSFDVLLTPGHSSGSVCLKYNNYVFSGDLIFFDSIGRSDFPHSNSRALYYSIKKFLMVYKDNNLILPGHGQVGFLKDIRINNIYLRTL